MKIIFKKYYNFVIVGINVYHVELENTILIDKKIDLKIFYNRYYDLNVPINVYDARKMTITITLLISIFNKFIIYICK